MTNLEAAFSRISELADSFRKHEADFLTATYTEADVRKDFIDKFFQALGWDVYHEEQKNPYAQEVKIEAAVKTGKSKRRADYAFFIMPDFRDPKFLCEAKKPSRNLRNADDYFQAVRYGWNRQTPLVLLFDFAELHIIDSRYKPDIATMLKVWHKSYRYTDYTDKETFAEIYFLLARDEVASGAIENYVQNVMPEPKGKAAQKGLFRGGYQPVDTAFLEDLDDYRLTLAKAFKSANPALDGEALTEAVQRTLDRLVFMRFLEDKQIEEEEVKNFGDKGTAWKNFISRCRTLDDKYNGIIFKPSLIDDAPNFVAPNDTHFRQITDQLSDNNSPYDFDSIPINILGSIYERFLGKIVVTSSKRANVDEKPEVRKAGGVYYTPEYIVRYIVTETVGQLIEGKTPEEIAKMSFADIACGSGSFLIEVYTVLLEYHARYYADNPDKAKKDDTELKDGVRMLSLKKRRDILQQNIFGVDIDFQAVEVSQLSLYLKMLEDATPSECFMFPKDYKERILPDLSSNIVCGNSLVGKDFWGMFDDEKDTPQDRRKINAMDFETAFPAVHKYGGFDAIVGNPPYVRQETLGEKFKKYAKLKYKTFAGTADLFVYFIERGVSLLKPGGQYGIIVANKWMRASYGKALRSWLKNSATHRLEEVTDFGDLPVFQGATTYPCILRLSKRNGQKREFFAAEVKTLKFDDLKKYVAANRFTMHTSSLGDHGWTLVANGTLALLQKLHAAGVPLGEYVEGKIYYGIKTGLNEAFVIDEETKKKLIKADPKSAKVIKPFLAGRDIKRYEQPRCDKFLISIPNGWTMLKMGSAKQNETTSWKWFKENYPAVAEHLVPFEKAGKKRYDQGTYWWELRPCDYYKEFEKPKIIYPNICKQPEFTFDKNHLYTNQKCFIIPIPDKYLIGVLNSKVTMFLFQVILPKLRGDFFEPSYIYFKDFPIRKPDLTKKEEKALHDKMVGLVDEMLETKKEMSETLLGYRKTQLEMEIRALDRQIDALVYELYGLSEEEIALVEGV